MQNASLLENEFIKLRALESSDIELLYAWENDTSNWFISDTLLPFSKSILKEYIKHSHEDIFTAKQLRLIIVDKLRNNKVVGIIDLFDFDPFHKRAGIGILIDSAERSKGFGFLSLQILKKYCFQILQLHQIYANIVSDNTTSIHLFEKAGFVSSSVKKDWVKSPLHWCDELLMQCIER
jgi:diamine N-acetyltransferase